MKKILTYLVCSFLLAGCASKHIPDWTYAGYNQLETFKKSYLEGDEKIAALHFTKATTEIKKSGDPDILARAYLTKYAVETAALAAIDDRMYLTLAAVQSTPKNSAFYHFLRGDFDRMDTQYLPEQYRALADVLRKGNQTDLTGDVTKIDDHLSRLIAAGIIVQHREYDEKLLQTAVETASANGWKKALLAYLDKLADYYKTYKDTEKENRIRQRIDLMK